MHGFRAILKRCIAYALYYSGALWLFAAVRLRHRAVVLTYHRVLPADADSFSDSGIIVTPATFAANMRFLRKHFTPLSAPQFESCLQFGRFPRNACLVTFDDGWSDNETHALPIIQRLALPIVIFVSTGFVGTTRTFWQERMTRQLFALSRHPRVGVKELTEIGLGGACIAQSTEARRMARSFVTRLKSSSTAEIEEVALRLTAADQATGIVESTNGDDMFLDWNALKRMSSTGLVTIASHSHSHVPLPRLGPEGAIADLRRSVQEIERHDLPVPSMCAYPNGDFDSTTMDCLTHVGLKAGFTTEHGYVRAGDDPRRLSRVNIHENAASTPPEFFCRLLGLF